MQRIIENITPRTALVNSLSMKRVAAYARVSCLKDAMLQSLSAQVSHYSSYIQTVPGWQYAGVYADEGISGTKTERRGFQQMLEDCRIGKIDIIITKSISRFARNTLTTLQAVRELRGLGVDVFFEEQNLHTLDGDGEFLLTILAAYAQAEAESASENQRWRIKANYEKGLLWSVTMYGFRQVGWTLEVVPEEAEILRLFADLYLEGYGVNKLARALEHAGVRGRHGGIMNGKTLLKLIFNEKMVGDLLLQKKYISDPIEKKLLINRGERPQYYITNSHPAIFERETYSRLLAENERRSAKYRPAPSQEIMTYPFTGKLVCGACGAHYRRKTVCFGKNYKRIVWICDTFNNKGKTFCASQQIPEDILLETAARVLDLPEFNAAAFQKYVTEIRVPENGVLIFVWQDGSETRAEWRHKSRRESWTPEMRQKAREHALKRNSTKGEAL